MRVDEREVQHRVAIFTEATRKAGVRLTPQRLGIFREIAGSLDHPSAEAVLKAIQPRMPTVSLDTVYRTLWLLNDLGLVSTLGPRRERIRFDANLKPHHHYVCVSCGSTNDFESEELNSLRVPASVKELGTIAGTHVEVRGICSRCAKEQAAELKHRNRNAPRGKKRSTR